MLHTYTVLVTEKNKNSLSFWWHR